MSVNTAPVKWAQRADSIYLTLDLPDIKDEQLKLTKDTLSFRQAILVLAETAWSAAPRFQSICSRLEVAPCRFP